jgi:hypothetical protein
LGEFARDCAGRGQTLVYQPLKLLEDRSILALFDKLEGWLSVSHTMLVSGQLDDTWIHERTHAVIDHLLDSGVDHVLHGVFVSKDKSPLHSLLYGDICSFDEILACKEELKHVISRCDLSRGFPNRELLTKVDNTAYAGAIVSRILCEGVAQRAAACLDDLNSLKKAPNAYLKTVAMDGSAPRLELGILKHGFLNTRRLDLWDAQSSLLVKIADDKMAGMMEFELADAKWLRFQRELRQEAVDKNLDLAQVMEHPHFRAIVGEVRARCAALEALTKAGSRTFMEICKLCDYLRQAEDRNQLSGKCILALAKIIERARSLDLRLPFPEAAGT